MQKNRGLIFDCNDRSINGLQKEMEFLPQGTPLFLSDENGKILFCKNHFRNKSLIFDVNLILANDDLKLYISKRYDNDCFVLETNDAGGKRFVVLNKNKDGLFCGALCDCDEKNCLQLCEYFERICLYRDYIDSVSGLASGGAVTLSAVSNLDSRINGARCLLKLSDKNNCDNLAEYAVPILPLITKLSAVMSAESGASVICGKAQELFDAAVVIPLELIRVLVSCIGLAARYSRDNVVHLDPFMEKDGTAVIKISVSTYEAEQDYGGAVFERAALYALNIMGVQTKIRKNHGEFVLHMAFKTAKVAGKALAESDAVLEHLTQMLLEKDTLDILFTMR